MNSKTMVMLVGAALLATAVPVLAWTSPSDLLGEPDSVYDSSLYMYNSTNTQKVDKVYFNGFQVSNIGPTVIGSTISAPGVRADPNAGLNGQAAILGYWRDCNYDGFIGNAATGTRDYPAALGGVPAGKTDICTGTPYNDGRFIHEFRNIGPQAQGDPATDTPLTGDPDTYSGVPYEVADINARVWMDYGLPNSTPANPGQPVFPAPAHAFDNAGELLDWIDASTGVSGAAYANGTFLSLDTATGHNPNVNNTRDAYNSAVADSVHAAYFQVLVKNGHDVTQTSIVEDRVNDSDQANTMGTPLVKVWDCDQHADGSFTPGNGVTPSANPNAAGSVNPDGSIDPTLVYNTGWNLPPGSSAHPAGECNHGNAHASVPFGGLESSGQVVQGKDAKKSVDVHFNFFTGLGHWKDTTTGVLDGQSVGLGLTPFGTDAGLSLLLDNGWTGRTVLIGGGFDGTLGGGSRIYTFYAYTSKGVTPAGTTPYTYGSEKCGATAGSPTAADAGGWHCSNTPWIANDVGDTQCQDLASQGVADSCTHVGDPYNLRDIDCIDSSVDSSAAGVPNGPRVALHTPTGALRAVADPPGWAASQVKASCAPYAG